MFYIETVKIANSNPRTGYAIINKSDFIEGAHELYIDKVPLTREEIAALDKVVVVPVNVPVVFKAPSAAGPGAPLVEGPLATAPVTELTLESIKGLTPEVLAKSYNKKVIYKLAGAVKLDGRSKMNELELATALIGLAK